MLGDTPIQPVDDFHEAGGDHEDSGDLPPHARSWVKQNGLTFDELQQVFHIDQGEVHVIASEIPGKFDKEKTYNAYVLASIAGLLSEGVASFSDKSARELCKNFGCLNAANHTAYMRAKDNKLAGSKEKGWTLTAPGLKHGATLVKDLRNQ